jgi:tetratricopeptide (TPR) repeat protein
VRTEYTAPVDNTEGGAMFLRLFFMLILFSTGYSFAQQGKDTPQDIGQSSPRIVDFASGLSTDNKEAKRLYDAGSDYLRNNNLKDAEQYLLNAIKIEPGFYEAMDHLGLVYKRQNRLTEAEEIYLKSLAVNKDNVIPCMNLAGIYRSQNRLQEATEFLLRATTVEPEYPEPYFQLAEIFQAVKQFEVSANYAKTAIELYLEDGDNSDELYYAYRMQGVNFLETYKFREAIENFEKANVFFKDAGIREMINKIKEYVNASSR